MHFSQADKIKLPYTDMVSTVPGKVTAKNSVHLWAIKSYSFQLVRDFISRQVKRTENIQGVMNKNPLWTTA